MCTGFKCDYIRLIITSELVHFLDCSFLYVNDLSTWRSRFTLGPTLSASRRVTLQSHRDARALSPSERANMRLYAQITLTTVVVVQYFFIYNKV